MPIESPFERMWSSMSENEKWKYRNCPCKELTEARKKIEQLQTKLKEASYEID